MRISQFFILILAMLLVVSFSLHNFIQHQHYGEYHDEHSEEGNNKAGISIQAFFHGDDRKMLWILLSSILALFGAVAFFDKKEEYITLSVKNSEFQYFIIPFREAFRRGIINPKLY